VWRPDLVAEIREDVPLGTAAGRNRRVGAEVYSACRKIGRKPEICSAAV
jgi:hypothetical protein